MHHTLATVAAVAVVLVVMALGLVSLGLLATITGGATWQ